ncbi:DUF6838 family protein [Tissierella sp.]|uniref:phage tail terminator family protein n=1 Tax=Tissierella sp. TaxID=41274 RepID=UPI002867041C|nr:hypothetical protein [Tissierella sp.]MDR7856304.1 hypothetical protein [Tissierella sp.]
MISNIRQEIVNKLLELYPTYTVYVDDIPQNFQKPSFLIDLIEQDYEKRMNRKFNSLLSFDIAYFSNSKLKDLKEDCQEVKLNLFREMDLIGSYRALSKQATITDNVLHFTFNINYSEIKVEQFEKMQEVEDIKTNL